MLFLLGVGHTLFCLFCFSNFAFYRVLVAKIGFAMRNCVEGSVSTLTPNHIAPPKKKLLMPFDVDRNARSL